MRRKSLLFIALLMLSILSINASAHAQGNARWTVMVYFAADNNLEPESITNLMEMAQVGSSDSVNIVAQITRPPDYKGFYGDWGGTRRFLITKSDGNVSSGDFQISEQRFTDYLKKIAPDSGIPDSAIADFSKGSVAAQEKVALNLSVPQVDPQTPLTPLQISSVQDMGTSVNSGDAASLADFGTWAVKTYPADHYALVMWDHGGGWSMIASDDTLAPDGMHMPDFANALKTITAAAGVDKLDIVGFDACLMGQLPVAVTVAPYAKYMIAAEELVPGSGWNYLDPLQTITANADSVTPEDIGKADVDAFYNQYTTTLKDSADSFDLGLLDLSKVDAVTTSLSAFADAVKASPDGAVKAIGDARQNVQEFAETGEDSPETEFFSSVDLIHLMQLVGKASTDDGVKNAANGVIDAAKAVILYHKNSTSLPNSNGLSIFFPRDASTFDESDGARYTQEFGSAISGWQSFLENFYGAAKTGSAAASSSTPLTVKNADTAGAAQSISASQPPVIPIDLNGENIVAVNAYVMYQLDAQTTITVDTFPLGTPETDADGDTTYSYADGASSVDFKWDVKIPTLSDGTTTLPVLVSLNPDDRTTGYIDGIYTSQLDGSTTPGYLTVDMTTMTVDGAWSLVKRGGVETDSEQNMGAGDTFEPTYEVVDQKGDSTYVPAGKTLTFAGDPTTFDAVPFTVSNTPAPAGNYTVLIEADDVAGTVSTTEIPLTVTQ